MMFALSDQALERYSLRLVHLQFNLLLDRPTTTHSKPFNLDDLLEVHAAELLIIMIF